MIDKIIFTRDKETLNLKEQLEFQMPIGYKLYAPDGVFVDRESPSVIDFKIKMFSEKPITLIFTEAIHSTDFKIIDRVQMLPPLMTTDLKISVINPDRKSQDWTVGRGSLVATMVPVETVSINLFEVSNRVFRKYV